MRKCIILLALIAASALLLGAAPGTASAAANCSLGVSPYSNGGHPAAQATFFNCTDVDKIQFYFYYANGGEWYDDIGSPSALYANKMLGINACGSNGWITPGSSFTCLGASGTICGAGSTQCSIWAYKTDWTMACGGSKSISAFVGYRLHRYSTNTWGSYAYYQTPWTLVC